MKYIIVAALEMETEGLQTYAPLVHTGIGKVNAAIHLYAAIMQYQPDLVINYGTAGSTGEHSGLLKVDTFVQRDMDVRGLGFPRGVTPFSDEELPQARGIVLGSGDSFVDNHDAHLDGLDIDLHLLDMEAFAFHEVCKHHQVDFHCYKFVTDGGDESASNDWRENVARGAHLFADVLDQQYGHSKLLKEPLIQS